MFCSDIHRKLKGFLESMMITQNFLKKKHFSITIFLQENNKRLKITKLWNT